jgi:hypothetical protein
LFPNGKHVSTQLIFQSSGASEKTLRIKKAITVLFMAAKQTSSHFKEVRMDLRVLASMADVNENQMISICSVSDTNVARLNLPVEKISEFM